MELTANGRGKDCSSNHAEETFEALAQFLSLARSSFISPSIAIGSSKALTLVVLG